MTLNDFDWDKSVFLAHASEDKDFVKRFYDQAKEAGLHPWLDSECLMPGVNWNTEIEKAIKKARFFMAFISPKSIVKVGYIQREFKRALKQMEAVPAGRIYLIPVFTEANMSLPDLSVEIEGKNVSIRTYHATDISTSEKRVKLINYLLNQIGESQRFESQQTFSYKTVKDLIANNKIEDALELLNQYCEDIGKQNNGLTMLMGRFNRLKKDNLMGIMGGDQFNLENNKIVYSLLQLINEMENN